MNIVNTKLDIEFVRSQFPAFNDPLCKEWSFFENAGGSYVPHQVIKKLKVYSQIFCITLSLLIPKTKLKLE